MSYRPEIKINAQGGTTDFPLDAETVKGVDVVNTKQDKLVSGTNIKTISGTSLLGSGNIGAVRYDSEQTLTSNQKSQVRENLDIPGLSSVNEFTNDNDFQDTVYVDFDSLKDNGRSGYPSANEVFKPDFVNAEYNKRNLLDSTTTINGILINSTNGAVISDSNANGTDYIEIEPNTIYINNFQPNWSSSYGLAFYNSSKTYISGIVASSTSYRKFTTPSNAKYIRICWFVASGSIYATLKPSLSIENGGELVRANDVERVLLWENGNPNSSFSAQTITTLPMSDFTYIIIGYKTNMNSSQAIQYEKVKYAKGYIFQIYNAWAGGTYSYSREFRFDSEYSTLMYIYPGYKEGDTYDNERIIPVVIYGTNVL